MLVIIGISCSGKDTLVNYLTDNYNFKKIITYTTRPPREGEVNGKTYCFISEDYFQNLIQRDCFFEYTSYNVASGETWYYGTLKRDIKEHFDNGVIILNPSGFNTFKKYYPDIFCVRLYAPMSVIRRRLIQRGDNLTEAERRLKADMNDFMLLETSDVCNIAINTNDYTVSEIADEIDKAYKEFLKNEK